ncbi:hypothetical protein LXL04_035694 [Taraxacum kok-saghyz]
MKAYAKSASSPSSYSVASVKRFITALNPTGEMNLPDNNDFKVLETTENLDYNEFRDLSKSYEERIQQLQKDLSLSKEEVNRVESSMLEALGAKNGEIEALVNSIEMEELASTERRAEEERAAHNATKMACTTAIAPPLQTAVFIFTRTPSRSVGKKRRRRWSRRTTPVEQEDDAADLLSSDCQLSPPTRQPIQFFKNQMIDDSSPISKSTLPPSASRRPPSPPTLTKSATASKSRDLDSKSPKQEGPVSSDSNDFSPLPPEIGSAVKSIASAIASPLIGICEYRIPLPPRSIPGRDKWKCQGQMDKSNHSKPTRVVGRGRDNFDSIVPVLIQFFMFCYFDSFYSKAVSFAIPFVSITEKACISCELKSKFHIVLFDNELDAISKLPLNNQHSVSVVILHAVSRDQHSHNAVSHHQLGLGIVTHDQRSLNVVPHHQLNLKELSRHQLSLDAINRHQLSLVSISDQLYTLGLDENPVQSPQHAPNNDMNKEGSGGSMQDGLHQEPSHQSHHITISVLTM